MVKILEKSLCSLPLPIELSLCHRFFLLPSVCPFFSLMITQQQDEANSVKEELFKAIAQGIREGDKQKVAHDSTDLPD